MILRLTVSYLKALRRHRVVAGTPPAQAIARVLRELESGVSLPLAGDERVIVPPAMEAWVRQVRGTPFSVVYIVVPPDQVSAFTLWLR